MIFISKKVKENRLLLYELNEVPIKVLKLYVEKNPLSSFAYLLNNGLLINTYTFDEEELHPWSTWPTVHRGVTNKVHNIKFINQDLNCAKEYKPIWEILSLNSISVGVFGSLQSYPPIVNSNISFFLPDTFSPDENSYPDKLSKFQKFNLEIVGKNKAIARKISLKQVFDYLGLALNDSISISSIKSSFFHILKEFINKKYASRRSILQGVFTFDLYLKYLNKYQPRFSTYFTNHVAGMMHRYWRNLFPEDFNLNSEDVDKFHKESIFKAMDIADIHMRQLLLLSKKKNYDLLIVSSMGQKSMDWGNYIPELALIEFKKFLDCLELKSSDYELLPAMQPDICIKAINENSLNFLRSVIKDFVDKNGNPVLIERYEPEGMRLNLSIQKLQEISKSKIFIYKENIFNVEDAGFQIISRDIGTGYHTPEGILIAYGKIKDNFKKFEDKTLDTRSISPMILDYFGVEKPSYMRY